MVVLVLCFVGGAAALQLQAQLPQPALAASLLLPAALCAIGGRGLVGRPLRAAAACVLAAGAGFFWAASCAGIRLADELPPQWEGRDIGVIGTIAKLPQPFERGIRFELDVERVLEAGARVPARVSIAWYGAWAHDPDPAAMPALRAGERWRFSVRLRRPHGTANPHGFDYEAWLLERGIRATGYVRLSEPPQRLSAFVPRLSYGIERARAAIRDRILEALAQQPYAGVIAALVMGDQRAIPPAQWTIFTRTGVNHLMSISGLHVTMIAALVFTLVHALWRRSARFTLWVPARRAATLAGFACALMYAAIAGFAIPAQRTVYMLAVVACALWLGQVSSAASILAVALATVTVLDPWAALAPGFWLSFGAVAVILHAGGGRLRAPHWALTWLRTQWAVTVGLVPLLLAMFQQVSLVSPLANAIAIPVVSLAVVPLALLGMALPLDAVLQLAHALMAYTMLVLEWLAAVPGAVWQQHAPPPWTIAVALGGIVWLLLPRGFPARWIGALALVPLFAVVPPGPPPGAVRLTVLDVGQGLAVVVRTAQHALLYDAGPSYSAQADSGSRIVVPYLRATGVRRLDALVVTHADNDHAGGAASVLSAVPVERLLSSLPQDHALHAAAARSILCHAGQDWSWDGVRFEMLHPQAASYAATRLKANDRSCVLRISGARTRVLLAGDAEARSERDMLARDPGRLRAEILVVPHHGSTTSSLPEFIAAVRPDTAVFTAGYRNRFGHPRPEVLERYSIYGSRILRTDRHGALELDVGHAAVELRAWRDMRRRYWQDPPSGLE
ncbi:MAG: DNA internalization-related competence protein ComEC/Rec2 [Burkholderiales bacterium]|nr:DNA internalization-related competence protein ComEC/Rec2 [Burkholderiales bacterium]